MSFQFMFGLFLLVQARTQYPRFKVQNWNIFGGLLYSNIFGTCLIFLIILFIHFFSLGGGGGGAESRCWAQAYVSRKMRVPPPPHTHTHTHTHALGMGHLPIYGYGHYGIILKQNSRPELPYRTVCVRNRKW